MRSSNKYKKLIKRAKGVIKSARIYYRNSVNGGRLILPLESEENLSGKIEIGNELEILVDGNIIRDLTKGKDYRFKPFGPVKDIIEAGGLIEYNLKKLELK